MKDIKAGDVVKLKSGSLPMTVESIGDSMSSGKFARVVWMNTDAEVVSASIILAALQLAQ